MNGVTEKELLIIQKIIKEVAPDCIVRAFGSRHKGLHKTHSDLDLAFVQSNGKRLELRKKGELKEWFMNSDIPYRVDVIDYNGCSPEFKAIIDEQNEIVFSSTEAET